MPVAPAPAAFVSENWACNLKYSTLSKPTQLLLAPVSKIVTHKS